VGAAGAAYALITGFRMRRQTAYKPDSEDWLFHAIVPFAAYLLLFASAVNGVVPLRDGLFGVAGGTLLLLFCGIHNTWDATAWHVLARSRDETKPD